MIRKKLLLPIIVFSQFAGTSLWFVGNVVIGDLSQAATSQLSNITSVVQFGFIAGTLVFSLLTFADRFPAKKVFFISSLIAAVSNFFLLSSESDPVIIYCSRFITGFFLAGIYPVGMKIAADCFPGKLGQALGFLVGALVLGTAFPHIIKSQLEIFNWQDVVWFSSALAATGGLLILFFVPSLKTNSPLHGLQWKTSFTVFRSANFRAAAFGYFGHMWELYAFWSILPVFLLTYQIENPSGFNLSLWSFLIIATGAAGCVIGGILSKRTGSKKIALYSLVISGICCLMSPLLLKLPAIIFFPAMMIWGFTVVSDSPQFSALVAQSAPSINKGTALTIVTSLGFAITIVSIQLISLLADHMKQYLLMVLFIGPLAGALSLKKYLPETTGR